MPGLGQDSQTVYISQFVHFAARGLSPAAIVKVRERNMSTELISKVRQFEGWLKGDAGNRVFEGSPGGFSRTRATQLACAFMRANPRVLQCTQSSILESISNAATLGLQINGILGEGYLVPYKNQCTFQLGYKGIIALARREQDIIITTRCVYKGDQFDYEMGDVEYIKHKRGDQEDFPDEDVTHVYMIARRGQTGEIIYRSVWTANQVKAHAKRYSKALDKPDSPWNTAWSAMARKTLIREAFNRGELPVSTEIESMQRMKASLMEEELRDLGLDPSTGKAAVYSEVIDTEPQTATDRVAAALLPAQKPVQEEKTPKKPRRKATRKKAEPEPEPEVAAEPAKEVASDEPETFEEQAGNLF